MSYLVMLRKLTLGVVAAALLGGMVTGCIGFIPETSSSHGTYGEHRGGGD